MVIATALETWEAVIGVLAMALGYAVIAALWWLMIGAPRRRERHAARDGDEHPR